MIKREYKMIKEKVEEVITHLENNDEHHEEQNGEQVIEEANVVEENHRTEEEDRKIRNEWKINGNGGMTD